ncbi:MULTISPECIES: sigma-70 family RNA polymerase sigma factor [Priestia]|uniref:sigma-70 family RNA polymerase sigma factor n=1 Tax=Priestia TaxID=2800373 RepID=UPI000E1174F8|nr:MULTISPECIES: sigma-70 family RNA polymerase sigma factor [Priestia]MDE8672805.1 sigma-70 family RNA polymerase sigma factor [Priestia aryabhattai]MED4389674.1 sigma-70 family RNA polymerase sigma factor [Priestia aryabhattai]SUV10050.1 RNA polymerase sigma-70factor [Priestia megaterium]
MEDDWIVACIMRKKEKGLELLIDQYGGLITAIVRKHLGTLKSYEEECINDVLLAVWHHIHRFDSEKNTFKNWVAAVAKYKAIDYQRKYIKTQHESLNEAEFGETSGVHNVRGDDLEELLGHLSEGDRELFKAYYLQEIELKQIAKKQETTISNLYNRLSRGRKKLKAIFK